MKLKKKAANAAKAVKKTAENISSDVSDIVWAGRKVVARRACGGIIGQLKTLATTPLGR